MRFGLSPFNLIFGILDIWDPWWIVAPIRFLRYFTVAKFEIISEKMYN